MTSKMEKAALVSSSTGAVVGGTSAVLTTAGFTSSGIAAGSVAAGVQAGIGNVAAGSAFAGLQSLGATGVIAVLGPVGLAAMLIGGVIFGVSKACKKSK